jgi:hypothetical protein
MFDYQCLTHPSPGLHLEVPDGRDELAVSGHVALASHRHPLVCSQGGNDSASSVMKCTHTAKGSVQMRMQQRAGKGVRCFALQAHMHVCQREGDMICCAWQYVHSK